jgi:Cof subfamily protein (haloacid dehalogenase superfamily)
MIRLLLIDVDGTLIGPAGVPDRVWDSAARARAAGVHLGICTGRSGAGRAMEYARRLDGEGLHVFDGGAVVMRGDGQVALAEELPRPLYEEMVELARRHALDLETYTAAGGFFVARQTPPVVAHQRGLGREAIAGDLLGVAGPIVRVQFVVSPGPDWGACRATIAAHREIDLHEASSPILPELIFATVTRRGISKVSGARRVADALGLAGLAEVAMVGDADNDLELIRAAGLGVAMGNAPPHVQEAADRVVARVEEGGLADLMDALATAAAATR